MLAGAQELRVGHPARAEVRNALFASLLLAGCFVLFALGSTQIESLRVGSPWQDDPFDAVVSFTVFLVAGVAVLAGLRTIGCRANAPLPVERLLALLRAAETIVVLVALTCLTDWFAVALGVHRAEDGPAAQELTVGLGAVSAVAAATGA